MSYSDQELETLLDDIESDFSERKETWKGDAPDKGRQAICAFANDLPDHRKPGVLFVGVKDDGTPTGLPEPQWISLQAIVNPGLCNTQKLLYSNWFEMPSCTGHMKTQTRRYEPPGLTTELKSATRWTIRYCYPRELGSDHDLPGH